MLNDSVFENYNDVAQYYDDNCDKTAFYLEFASSQEVQGTYIRRTQDYGLMSFSALPSMAFKLACAHGK